MTDTEIQSVVAAMRCDVAMLKGEVAMMRRGVLSVSLAVIGEEIYDKGINDVLSLITRHIKQQRDPRAIAALEAVHDEVHEMLRSKGT